MRDQIKPAVRRRSHMRKITITSVAAMALVAAGTFFGSMHRTSQSDSDLNALFGG
jgi:hypothetical protein